MRTDPVPALRLMQCAMAASSLQEDRKLCSRRTPSVELHTVYTEEYSDGARHSSEYPAPSLAGPDFAVQRDGPKRGATGLSVNEYFGCDKGVALEHGRGAHKPEFPDVGFFLVAAFCGTTCSHGRGVNDEEI